MLVEVDNRQLQKALAGLARVAKTSGTLPALSHVLMAAEREKLTLETSNLEQLVHLDLPAVVHGEGMICAPVKQLLSLLRWTEGRTVDLVAQNSKVVIMDRVESSDAEICLPALEAGEFPRLECKALGQPFEVATGDLRFALRRVLPLASRLEARPVLNCVNFQYRPGSLAFTVTDGFRAARWTIPAGLGPVDPFEGLLPPRAVELLLSPLFAKMGGIVIDRAVYGLNTTVLTFSAGETRLTTLLGEGIFPDLAAIRPKKLPFEATVNRWMLMRAISQALEVLGRGAYGPVRVSIKNNEMAISAENEEFGSVVRRIGVVGDAQINIAFNPALLLDILHGIPERDITLRMASNKAPVLITGENYEYLIMPMFAD